MNIIYINKNKNKNTHKKPDKKCGWPLSIESSIVHEYAKSVTSHRILFHSGWLDKEIETK